jgi:hypothetical protein
VLGNDTSLRIGRSGRFGRKGVAINFVKDDDIRILRDIEQFYSTQIDEMVRLLCWCTLALTYVANERRRADLSLALRASCCCPSISNILLRRSTSSRGPLGCFSCALRNKRLCHPCVLRDGLAPPPHPPLPPCGPLLPDHRGTHHPSVALHDPHIPPPTSPYLPYLPLPPPTSPPPTVPCRARG